MEASAAVEFRQPASKASSKEAWMSPAAVLNALTRSFDSNHEAEALPVGKNLAAFSLGSLAAASNLLAFHEAEKEAGERQNHDPARARLAHH
jgi:hypothetical protein